jgi:hypothetical protein
MKICTSFIKSNIPHLCLPLRSVGTLNDRFVDQHMSVLLHFTILFFNILYLNLENEMKIMCDECATIVTFIS